METTRRAILSKYRKIPSKGDQISFSEYIDGSGFDFRYYSLGNMENALVNGWIKANELLLSGSPKNNAMRRAAWYAWREVQFPGPTDLEYLDEVGPTKCTGPEEFYHNKWLSEALVNELERRNLLETLRELSFDGQPG